MLRTIRAQNTVPTVRSIFSLPPTIVLVVLKDYVPNQRRGRMTENKEELSDWIEDIVAFHKTKRKFVNLKEMESQDADLFLICEFKGYDFEILAN
jgi:hypothetical protein